jgi:hypothetical protein
VIRTRVTSTARPAANVCSAVAVASPARTKSTTKLYREAERRQQRVELGAAHGNSAAVRAGGPRVPLWSNNPARRAREIASCTIGIDYAINK